MEDSPVQEVPMIVRNENKMVARFRTALLMLLIFPVFVIAQNNNPPKKTPPSNPPVE